MTCQPKLSKKFSNFFQANRNFETSIETSTFPKELKYADVKPVFKKDSQTDKKNYRTISILPNVLKIYERCLNKQLEEYSQALLSKYQCGFQRGYSVINALLPIIEKWTKSLDKGGAFGALLTDLSKAMDCLPHETLITKLHAYGVDIPSQPAITCSKLTIETLKQGLFIYLFNSLFKLDYT